MILADKILNLRKKNGWSQEELSAKLNVSRQSVSKWESAQATPDLDRILQLSQIFGVSTDYLIKDEIEEYELTEHDEPMEPVRRVSLEFANRFIEHMKEKSVPFGNAISLFIISPIVLLLMLGLFEEGIIHISENIAAANGIGTLLIIVALGVAVLLRANKDSEEFEFLSTEHFETEYGVDGLVKDRKEDYKDVHNRKIMLGIGVILLAPIALFVGIGFEDMYGDFAIMISLCVLLILIAIGVNILVKSSMIMNGYKMLLQDGEYSKESKAQTKYMDSISTIYWVTALAVFLLMGFVWNAWHINWVVWPIAGLMYVVLVNILNLKGVK